MFVPHAIQTGMVGLHDLTGTPWWATIGISTLFVRLSLFPLVRSQILAARQLAAAMPEINFLFQLLMNRLRAMGGANARERSHVLNVFVKGVNACLRLHDVSKVELVAYPLVNVAMFMTFVLSVRDMIVHAKEYEEFEQGGLLWFTDLSIQVKPCPKYCLLNVFLYHISVF
jgi:YidC/Oxa1 family membrane protein insertase